MAGAVFAEVGGTLVAPRIVNNVSCVKRINDECVAGAVFGDVGETSLLLRAL